MRRPLHFHVRRPLAVAATTALLVTLTACGGDEPDNASGEPTTSESSDPTEATDTGEQPEAGADVEPADFVADMKAGLEASTTAHMTMEMGMPTGSMSVEGQVDYTTDPVSMAMTMANGMMGDQAMDLRLVDGVMFMNMGSLSNDKFIEFDLSGDDLPPGMEGLEEQMNPLAGFEKFEPALKKVTFVGDDDVDGETLQHYMIVLDSAKIEGLGMPAGAAMPPEVVYDLWFDDEFRPRQMEMAMEGESQADLLVKFFDWGSPVEIAAPPADQVVDGSQMGQATG